MTSSEQRNILSLNKSSKIHVRIKCYKNGIYIQREKTFKFLQNKNCDNKMRKHAEYVKY